VNLAPTSFARQIIYTINVAARLSAAGRGGLFFIGGDARVGKTFVAQTLAQERGFLFYPYDDGGGLRHVQRQLGKLVGFTKHGNAELVDKLHETFKAMPAPRVLVIDEMHLMLRTRTSHPLIVEFLRRLADICKISIVMVATFDRFREALAETKWNDKQFWGRCTDILILDPQWLRAPNPRVKGDAGEPRPIADDIAALHKFSCPEIKLDENIAKIWRAMYDHEKGGLGIIAECIVKARDFADADMKREFCREDLIACAERQLSALDTLTTQLRLGALRRRR
jgi:hypothetical protein